MISPYLVVRSLNTFWFTIPLKLVIYIPLNPVKPH